jgi:hypothetical protein
MADQTGGVACAQDTRIQGAHEQVPVALVILHTYLMPFPPVQDLLQILLVQVRTSVHETGLMKVNCLIILLTDLLQESGCGRRPRKCLI